MLKTNCNMVRQPMRYHVIEHFSSARYETFSGEQAVKSQIDHMRNKGESVYNAALRYAKDGNAMFAASEIRNFLKNLLQETDEEAEKYNDEQVMNLYSHLFAREAEYIYNKEK